MNNWDNRGNQQNKDNKDKRPALGKGLDALFGEAMPNNNDSVMSVDIHLLDNNPSQPRHEFNAEKLRELADSILQHGVVQPIIVQQNGSRYMIVAGERRFRAAKLAGLSQVPIIVRNLRDEEVFEIALIENIQRENLHPLEEATAIKYLMEQNDLTQDETATRLGKSRPAIGNSLRLLNLSVQIQNLMLNEKLQVGHAKVLLGVADEVAREKFAEMTVEDNWSVRELESRIEAANAPKTQKKKEKKPDKVSQDPVLGTAQESMRNALGTKVTIIGDENRGKITIDYYNRDMLESLYNLLCCDK